MKKVLNKVKKDNSEKQTKNKKLGVVRCKITNNKTLSTSHKNVKKNWILIDAKDVVVGRLGAFLVNRLKGKHLSSYTRNTDDGDKIVVINCNKVKFTGNKEDSKLYRRHSNYVGGLKEIKAKDLRKSKRPCDIVRITVKRMLGKCRLNYKLLSKNLFLYPDEIYKQVAQTPKVIDFSKLNRKNVINV